MNFENFKYFKGLFKSKDRVLPVEMYWMLIVIAICYSCEIKQFDIHGVWMVESGVYQTDTIPLVRDKMIFWFNDDELKVTKFGSTSQFLLDSVKGGRFIVDKDQIESNIFLNTPKAKFVLIGDRLEINSETIQLNLRRLPRFDGELIEREFENVLASNKLRFGSSKVNFRFHSNGTYTTSEMNSNAGSQKWKSKPMNGELFFNINNPNVPLFQIESIRNDSIILNTVGYNIENWYLINDL